jgi:hypothetical protein
MGTMLCFYIPMDFFIQDFVQGILWLFYMVNFLNFGVAFHG